MSEEFWETVLPEGSAPTSAPRNEQTAPLTRREARERAQHEEAAVTRREARERAIREEAAAQAAKRVRSGQRSRRAGRTRPPARPASVLPSTGRGRSAAPRRSLRAAVAKLMSFGAMVGVAGMLVATSVPANAFFAAPDENPVAQQQAAAEVEGDGIQSVAVKIAPTEVAAQVSARDAYTVTSLAEQLRKRYGNQTFSFTNNPNGTIQWPFATSVPISSGFGARVACSYCSSYHLGVDFVPGRGAPIQAIADGVVRSVSVANGGFGVHVLIDHEINGQKVTSLYAHMIWGSPAVAEGQTVTVGQYLGDVGSTGAATGPHLHLEIHIDDTAVDPFAWLKANAN